jgi:tripeptidyl-peptidase-1
LRNNPNYFSYMATDGEIPESTRGVYNRNGRGYPDISAVGDNGVIYHRGKLGLVGGTSQSAPIVAAIFNRINEERLNLGKGPIGFANPALYQAYDNNVPLFNDVTAGDQRLGGAFGHRYPSACGNKGFSAVAGWDPVTGLGTPRYPEMLKYFVDL